MGFRASNNALLAETTDGAWTRWRVLRLCRADTVLPPGKAARETADGSELVGLAAWQALTEARRISNGRGVGKPRPILGNVRTPKASRLAFMGQRSIE